jgi:hypothetical protein
VKNENGDLIADSHNILNRWKNYFSQLLNVHTVSEVRQIEVHTAEPFGPGPSRLEVEIPIEKFKKYKFRQNRFKQEAKYYFLRLTNSLILFGLRKNCLISRRGLLLYQFTKRVIKLAVIIIVGHHCYQLDTKFYRISSSQG